MHGGNLKLVENCYLSVLQYWIRVSELISTTGARIARSV